MKSLVYVVIALAAGLLGFVIYRQVIEPRVWEHVGLSGSAETDAPAGRSLDMPTHLPDFTLMDRAGEMRSIQSWPGKSLIVNFWATWCAPCRDEIPGLVELYEKHKDAGFVVLGVAVDDTVDALEPFVAELGMTYPVLVENGRYELRDAYGPLVGFPTSFLITREGTMCVRHVGIAAKEQHEAEIEGLL